VQSLNHHGLQRAAATVRRNLEHMLTTLDAAAQGGKVVDMQTVLQQYAAWLVLWRARRRRCALTGRRPYPGRRVAAGSPSR